MLCVAAIGGLRMDKSYVERRAMQERIAAAQAKHPKAKQAHLELALRLERQINHEPV